MSTWSRKEKYEELRKKFDLPEFSKINKDFEISLIDKKPLFLRNVRRKVNEKIIFFCRIIEGVLFPNGANFIAATENKVFSDDEKNEILKIYRELMVFERKSLSLDVDNIEEENVKFINEVFNKWPKFKKPLKDFVKKMESAWSREDPATTEAFFG